MGIKHSAIAGTLESSDAQVSIEPGQDGIELEVFSSVLNQYGRQIRDVVLKTLQRLGVKNARVTVTDKGALECTLRARVEAAYYRSIDKTTDFPWEVLE